MWVCVRVHRGEGARGRGREAERQRETEGVGAGGERDIHTDWHRQTDMGVREMLLIQTKEILEDFPKAVISELSLEGLQKLVTRRGSLGHGVGVWKGIPDGRGSRGSCAKAWKQRAWLILETSKSSLWLEVRTGGREHAERWS